MGKGFNIRSNIIKNLQDRNICFAIGIDYTTAKIRDVDERRCNYFIMITDEDKKEFLIINLSS